MSVPLASIDVSKFPSCEGGGQGGKRREIDMATRTSCVH